MSKSCVISTSSLSLQNVDMTTKEKVTISTTLHHCISATSTTYMMYIPLNKTLMTLLSMASLCFAVVIDEDSCKQFTGRDRDGQPVAPYLGNKIEDIGKAVFEATKIASSAYTLLRQVASTQDTAKADEVRVRNVFNALWPETFERITGGTGNGLDALLGMWLEPN